MDCLPDDVLVQILSFLPTKEAASTSLLSKRWRTLFTFNHNLDFDNSILLHHEDYTQKRLDIQKNFKDFVDRTLAFQGGNHLKKFSLKISEAYRDEDDVDRWICNALEQGVTELHLRLEYIEKSHDLPSKVFISTTLVKLSLGVHLFIKHVPPNTSLPALKVLLLDSVWFEGNQLSNVLLAACPALEDLTINHKTYPAYAYVISSKTIKKLSITNYCNHYVGRSSIISLETPSVVDLYFSDYLRLRLPHCNLDSLAKATLDLHFTEDYNRWGTVDRDLTDLISEICNVKTLHLTFSAVEVISLYYKGGLPIFNNLIELVFSSKKRGWKVLLPVC